MMLSSLSAAEARSSGLVVDLAAWLVRRLVVKGGGDVTGGDLGLAVGGTVDEDVVDSLNASRLGSSRPKVDSDFCLCFSCSC